jgi:hypothetical protein
VSELTCDETHECITRFDEATIETNTLWFIDNSSFDKHLIYDVTCKIACVDKGVGHTLMKGNISSNTSGCMAFNTMRTINGLIGSLGTVGLQIGVAGRCSRSCCRSTLSRSLDSRGDRSVAMILDIKSRVRGTGRDQPVVSEPRFTYLSCIYLGGCWYKSRDEKFRLKKVIY